MKIFINGDPVTATEATLAAVLIENGYGNTVVATAVNGSFVAAELRDDHALSEGDQIEVLAPMQGG